MADSGDACMTACRVWKNTAVVFSFFFSSQKNVRPLLDILDVCDGFRHLYVPVKKKNSTYLTFEHKLKYLETQEVVKESSKIQNSWVDSLEYHEKGILVCPRIQSLQGKVLTERQCF